MWAKGTQGQVIITNFTPMNSWECKILLLSIMTFSRFVAYRNIKKVFFQEKFQSDKTSAKSEPRT